MNAERLHHLATTLMAALLFGCGPTGGGTPDETTPPEQTPAATDAPTAAPTPSPTSTLTLSPDTPTASASTPTASAPSPTATAQGTEEPTLTHTAAPSTATPTHDGATDTPPTPTAPAATPTAPPPTPETHELYISQYVEGSSGFNKAIEIYNPKARAADLSEYAVWRISNGGEWAEFELPLTGTLEPGQTVVIAHDEADSPQILASADVLDDFMNFNGDDAVGLAHDGQLVDAVGANGDDVGDGWAVAGVADATKDHVLVRKASVMGPNLDWAASAGVDAASSEWLVQGMWGMGLLGTHPHEDAIGHRCISGLCQLAIPEGDFVRGACGNFDGDAACATGDLGYAEGASFDEAPVRVITLSAFYIDETEVTVARYRACVEAGACEVPSKNNDLCNYQAGDRDDHPINCVDWGHASAFCQWAGGHLPTEAQWEKAARGGCELAGDPAQCEAGQDDRLYPWGDDAPACFRGNIKTDDGFCQYGTTAVKTYSAGLSPYGLYDAAGNVREWVADWYGPDYYDPDYEGGSPDVDPPGASSSPSNGRAIRGGDWGSIGQLLRAAERVGSSATASGENYGFRCAYD